MIKCEHRYIRVTAISWTSTGEVDVAEYSCSHCQKIMGRLTKSDEEDAYCAEKVPPPGFNGW